MESGLEKINFLFTKNKNNKNYQDKNSLINEILKILNVNIGTGLSLSDKEMKCYKNKILNRKIQNLNQLIIFNPYKMLFLLFLSMLLDLTHIYKNENTLLFFFCMFIMLVLLVIWLHYFLYHLKYTNKIEKNQNIDKEKIINPCNLVFEVKRNSQKINVSLHDIVMGDILFLKEGFTPFNCVLINGEIKIVSNYRYKLTDKEFEFEIKNSENNLIFSNSYVIQGKAEVVCLSFPQEITNQNISNFLKIKSEFSPKINNYSLTPINYDFKKEYQDEDMKLLYEYFNDDSNWDILLNDDVCKIERKVLEINPEVPLIRTTAILENFSVDEVYKAIVDIEVRKSWDKNFDIYEKIESNEKYDVLYMILKSPVMFISQRELIQQRKIYSNPSDESKLIHFKSCVHEKYPITEKYVRAETIISGYHIQSHDYNKSKTKICIISQTDIKGSLPKNFVNQMAAKGPREWILCLLKALFKLKTKI
jgi:hypothetical protein